MKSFILLPVLIAISFAGISQNVGIGTNSPLEKLHVAGNIKTDTVKPNAIKLITNAGAGKVLTSDATGNASWQTSNAVAAANPYGNLGFGVWGNCQTNSVVTDFNPVEDISYTKYAAFGSAVSISGNFAVIGAPSNIGDTGTASIFKYDGTRWVFMQRLIDSASVADDDFGKTVSIYGNVAVVGSPNDNEPGTHQGSVSIFKYNGTSWVFFQKITDATGAAFDYFGCSVSVWGNYFIAGANGDDNGANINQGSASIYQFNGTSWVLMTKLIAAAGKMGDNYGISVSISGSYVIVGADNDQVGTNVSQGSAKVYQRFGANWLFVDGLVDDSGKAHASFGNSVCIAGNYAIVGAPHDSIGVNYQQGSACIFEFDGTHWVLMRKLSDASGSASDLFGSSVAISGNYAIVGANTDDVGANTDQGSASIYLRIGSSWPRLQYLTDPMGEADNFFGFGVALDAVTQRFLIGAGYNWTGLLTAEKAFFGRIF